MNRDASAITGADIGAELERYAPAVDAFIAAAFSPHTRRSYGSHFRQFCEWAASQGVSELPASPAAVAAYLSTLAEQGKALSTIRLASSAISAAHRARRLDDPCVDVGVKAVRKGIARLVGKPQTQAKPLTDEALFKIQRTACIPRRRGRGYELADTAIRRGLVDVALCRTMSDAGLRRSEAAALCWTDISEAPDGGGVLSIARSKTDPDGMGEKVYLTPATMSALSAIRNGSAAEAPVFGLTGDAIDKRIRAAAHAAGLGEGYSSHSGRVGLAVRMANAPTSAVMRQGRWASAEQVSRYQRGISATAAAAYLS